MIEYERNVKIYREILEALSVNVGEFEQKLAVYKKLKENNTLSELVDMHDRQESEYNDYLDCLINGTSFQINQTKYYMVDEKEGQNLTEKMRRIPRPLMPVNPDEIAQRSVYEWTSQGNLRINLQKTKFPSRWEKITLDEVPTNSLVWWDIHENYRQELINKFPLPSDKLHN